MGSSALNKRPIPADNKFGISPDPIITDPEANRDAPELAERLRAAIKLAGGATQVAARSRIPYRSLRHHLSGRDMKRPVLVALADACGVSIEWLAAGRGDMFTAQHRAALSMPTVQPAPDGKTLIPTQEYQQVTAPAPPAVAEAAAEPPSPRPSLDVDKLRQAIDILRVVGGPEALSADNAAARIASAYDVLIGNKP